MDEAAFDYEGPDELRDTVLQALRHVVDPEIALDIVAVGLVYGVEIAEDRVHVRMTMTSAACPVTDVLVDEVKAELADALPGHPQVDVELVWEPPWTPERLSASARVFMGW